VTTTACGKIHAFRVALSVYPKLARRGEWRANAAIIRKAAELTITTLSASPPLRDFTTYSFLQKFLEGPVCAGMAVDLLQCFPANCL
jgi:hypothetical protein